MKTIKNKRVETQQKQRICTDKINKNTETRVTQGYFEYMTLIK